ncbi:MAG: ATP-binding protein [Acidobacteria bacterium]|nr:ATP-binding protein [Acidobacteriota bacterium]
MSDRNSAAPSRFLTPPRLRWSLPKPPTERPGPVGRLFGDLKIRPKLMVLHNLFFLLLGASVYFSLIPLFQQRVATAKAREVSLLTKLFLQDRVVFQVPGMELYDYREGSGAALGIPPKILNWLELHPGQVYNDDAQDALFRLVPGSGLFRRVSVPNLFYDAVVQRAKITIFLVLGILYVLAVAVLELIVMPRYVYGPIQHFLDADGAVQAGRRQEELIPDKLIMSDEIGQIMRSRNAAVANLRAQEEALEAAKRSLEEQDRLASLGLLSASVAHEMNTPLAVLLGSIEKLEETETRPPVQERLARMKRVAQRLKKISESLVDFARVRKQEMEPVDLRPLIDEAWHLVAIDEKSAEVSFINLVAADVRVVGNADRLIQVFLNLLRNALNAIASGGMIQTTACTASNNGQPEVSIRVEDDGPGIPPEVLPEIFEAFVTTRLDARGTGLGLTVAEGIISQHGGTIAASNRPGGGASLEVRLPAA